MKNDMSDRWPVLEVAMMINLTNIQPFFFEFLKSQHPEIDFSDRVQIRKLLTHYVFMKIEIGRF